MHFSSAFLVFGIHGLNPLNGDSHHGLVSDLSRQFFVAHTGYVQVGLAAIDSCVVRRRGIAKRFRKATDFRPPLQRFRRVSSRKNRDRSLNDRLHERSITELQPCRLHPRPCYDGFHEPPPCCCAASSDLLRCRCYVAAGFSPASEPKASVPSCHSEPAVFWRCEESAFRCKGRTFSASRENSSARPLPRGLSRERFACRQSIHNGREVSRRRHGR